MIKSRHVAIDIWHEPGADRLEEWEARMQTFPAGDHCITLRFPGVVLTFFHIDGTELKQLRRLVEAAEKLMQDPPDRGATKALTPDDV